MKLDRYELKAGKNLITFEFISEGPNGQIPKLVQFATTNQRNIYNLAFGNKNLKTGQIDAMILQYQITETVNGY